MVSAARSYQAIRHRANASCSYFIRATWRQSTNSGRSLQTRANRGVHRRPHLERGGDTGWPIARCLDQIPADRLRFPRFGGKMPRGSRAPPWPRLAGIYFSGRIGDKLSLQHNFELSPLLHPNTEAIVLAGTPLRT